ncbi:MAG: sodium:solute symporter [Crocinitomicaceae bacterium TMED114]|nr:MAG: sodium:solute symporter [Crocinitomicaceae bacterium TMED114]
MDTPILALIAVAAYLGLLLFLGQRTGRKASMSDFSLGGRRSPWWAVAFGMIGTSLSGVTFLSVPGWVGTQQFGYMQMVLGYVVGYAVITTVLLPLYYRLQLTSIYEYLGQRIGTRAYKTGAAFFLLSRSMGAAFRLYLVVLVLNETVLPEVSGAAEWIRLTVLIAAVLGIIWAYTRRGGIATVVWTDTLQTACMLLAAAVAVVLIGRELHLSILDLPRAIADSGHARWWFFEDWGAANHGVKQFIAGAFISLCMTGLDQDMMQKNLSCRNLRDAQLNVTSFSVVLVFVNLLFLSLGALLLMHTDATGTVVERADLLFATVALKSSMGWALPILFLLGLVAAALSSADSALTALTTSVCVDFLGMDKAGDAGQADAVRRRQRIHLLVSMGVGLLILGFHAVNDTSVIAALFKVTGYTYGPLLGLFAFCLFRKDRPAAGTDPWIPWVAVAAPCCGYALEQWTSSQGFSFGFALLPVNGFLTWLGATFAASMSARTTAKA